MKSILHLKQAAANSIKWPLLLLMLALVSVAQATIRRVNASSTATNPDGSTWANAYKNFQSAINACAAGDVLYVSAGTYIPATSAAPFSMKAGVKIYGGYNNSDVGRDPKTYVSILQGNGNSVINNSSNGLTPANSLLDGFTVQNGNASGTGTGVYGYGGGIYNFYSAPTINNVIFKNNTAFYGGGALYNVDLTGSPIVTNCQFLSNTATQTTANDGSGGTGGAVYNDQSQPTFINCVFAGNYASRDGGGIENYGGQSANQPLVMSVVNCVFYNNGATSGVGGGIFTRGTYTTANVSNCTFYANYCGISGTAGGLYNYASGIINVANCVFWSNSSAAAQADVASVNATQTVSYTYSQVAVSGTGNITGTVNPFMNSGSAPAGADGLWMTADDNLQLSLCAATTGIDKGNNSAISSLNNTTDITGATRKVDVPLITDAGSGTAPIVDMGAYENQTTTTALQISGSISNAHTVPTPQEMSPDYVLNSTSPIAGATYSWQQSTDNNTWIAATPVENNQLSYTLPAITTTTFYRRVASTATYCNTLYASNSVQINVVQSNGTISGYVRSKNGTAVKGITVQAVRRGINTASSPAGFTYTTVTGDDGSYTLTPIYYGDPSVNTSKDSFYVSPIKAGHTFDFTTLSKTLSATAPSVTNVNFTDLTVYAVTGGTNQSCAACLLPNNNTAVVGCPIDSVQMYVNGSYISQSTLLDTGTNQFAHGRYAVTVSDPGTIKIKPIFNSHVFVPVDSNVVVTTNVGNVTFRDTTTHVISGQLTADCNDYIGSAVLEFTDILPNDVNGVRASCFRKRVTTDVNGFYSIRLPGRNYKVQVFNFSPATAQGNVAYVDPVTLMTFIDTMGNGKLIRNITNHDTTLNLIYHRPPVIKLIAGLDTLCNGTNRGFALFNQGISNSFTLKVYQGSPTLKSGVGCLVEDTINYVKVFTSIPSNDASNIELDYLPNDTGVVVKMAGGTPNIILPYNKTLSVIYTDSYNRSATFAKTVVVTGVKADAATFTTVSPQIPLLVLHDPPGDNSYSYQEQNQSTETALRLYSAKANNTNAWIEAKIGTEFSAGIGVSVETSIWGSIKGDVTVGSTNTTSNETILNTTTTQRFSTSSDPSVVGNDGDLIVGTALNLIYAMSTEIKVDGCAIASNRKLIVANNGFATQYIYTTGFIQSNIIPALQQLANSNGNSTPAQKASYQNQISVWQQVLSNNEGNKSTAAFDKNISFDGAAGAFENSTSTSVSKNNTIEFSMNIDATVAAELGFDIGGSGASGGISVNFKTETGTSNSTTITKQTTTGYILDDDDNGDFFSVDIKKDPVYSTPVFVLKAGTASCPAEENAQPRDEAQLAIPTPVVAGVAATDVAQFTLKLGNTSESQETRTYKLFFDPSSNPDGATIKVGGVAITQYAGDFTISPNSQTNVTVTVAKAQAPSNVFSYPNLRFYITDNCNGGANTGDSVLASNMVSAYFISPCSSVTLSQPANNFVVNSTAGNVLPVLITGYDVTGLSSISLEYSPAGTSNWLTGFTKANTDLNVNSTNGTLVNWNVAALSDGGYNIRLKLTCSQGIVYSQAIAGTINRTPPMLYGIPQPSDNNYVNGDIISFSYNENLVVNNLNNGQVTMQRLSNKQYLPVTVSGYGNTIQIVPNSSIASFVGDSIRVIVTNMTDLFGNIKTTPDTSNFIVGTSIVGTGSKALSLTISQNNINRNAAGTMDFRFNLAAPAPNDIAVNFSITGTALSNVDYISSDTTNSVNKIMPSFANNFNGSQGTIVIPTGATQAIFRVHPTGTSNSTSNKTVTLNLLQGGDYVLGAVNNITGTIINTTVLPLTLLSFTVQLTADGRAALQWKSTHELNTSYFVVERSTEGKNFGPVGNVAAVGIGDNPYSYLDATPVDGVNFYRLKMVDKDANFVYSPVVSVTKTTDVFEIISFSPSPLTGTSATLKMAVDKALKLRIVVIDVLGRITVLPDYTTMAGTNYIPLTLNQLAPGVYTIYASDGTRKTNTIRFVKQ